MYFGVSVFFVLTFHRWSFRPACKVREGQRGSCASLLVGARVVAFVCSLLVEGRCRVLARGQESVGCEGRQGSVAAFLAAEGFRSQSRLNTRPCSRHLSQNFPFQVSQSGSILQLALRLKQSPISPLPNHIFNPYAYVKLNYGTLYKGITSVPCRGRRKETKKRGVEKRKRER